MTQQKAETGKRRSRFDRLIESAEERHNSGGALKEVLKDAFPRFFPDKLLPDALGIAVFGWERSGKTALVRYLQSEAIDEHVPTIGVAREDFVIRAPHPQSPTRSATVWDVGGISEPLFYETLEEHSPDGVIFVVHHENRKDHKQAWDCFCEFIRRRGWGAAPSRVARKQLAAVLVLANMKDIWSRKHVVWRPEYVDRKKPNPHYMRRGKMKRLLEVDRRTEQLAKLGIQVLYRECSVKKGDGVDDAMVRFLEAILANRKTKHGRG